MKKQNLPLSPHLQIYKPQITSVLSISHRVTGFALNLTLIILVLGLFCIMLGEEYFNIYLKFFDTIPSKIIIYLSLLGFFYHMLNGIRHIIWDFGFFLENRSSSILGYLVIFLSISASIYLSIILGLFK